MTTKTINGIDIDITGPISVVTIDDKNYEIKDEAARTDITNIQEELSDLLNPEQESAYKDALKDVIVDLLYPVGSIYLSMNNDVPFERGTWERIGQGRALVGVNPGAALFGSVGATAGRSDWGLIQHSHSVTGGSHTHAMGHTHVAGSDGRKFATFTGTGSVEEISTLPNGAWEIIQIAKAGTWHTAQTSTGAASRTDTGGASHSHTCGSTGSITDGTNQNYQPSIAVSVWKRTS